MRILHVVPSFAPAWRYGGPIEALYRLCRGVAELGYNVRVITTDADGPDAVLGVDTTHDIELDKIRVRYCARIWRHSVSPTLLRLLPRSIRWADVVHLTGVYSFPTLPTLWLCRWLGKPVVWSPRGALQRWRGSRRRAPKAAWDLCCRLARPPGLVLHATSEEEARESGKRIPGTPTVVIPNGVDVPERVQRASAGERLRVLYLGRLDPKKGIENLLEAVARLKPRATKPFCLTIAGDGDRSYVAALQQRAAALELRDDVLLVGHVAGEAKTKLFERADVLVAPSYTENFGQVVAEALAHGVPVIASTGTPWKRVEAIGCGLWVDNDPETLARALERMMREPLGEMGRRGRAWMEREFSWRRVAEAMSHQYQLAVRGGTVGPSSPEQGC